MNLRISILGLTFLFFISAKNLKTAHNVLPIKSMNNSHLTINMRTILLNKKCINLESNNYNSNATKTPSTFNVSSSNSIAAVPNLLKPKNLVNFLQKTRFPRQTKKKFDKIFTTERPMKVAVHSQLDNQENYYDYYDDRKYYDNYRKKNINGLVDDCNLNSEIEINSKPVTKNINESQERKRCSIMRNAYNLSSRKLQQPQQLFSENIDVDKKPELKCQDCKFLKSSVNPLEPKISNNKTLKLKQISDDYFINILKQLIEKLNKPKSLKSSNNNDLPIQKINNRDLENRSVKKNVSNSSNEKEWLLKLEEIKRKLIVNKLNSSPENIYTNGEWVRSKIAENERNDYKQVVNNISQFKNKNESVLIDDTKQLNLTGPKNRVVESANSIFENLNNLQIISTEEDKEISTSPLPENNEHLLVPRETVEPIYSSSTPKHDLDSITINENSQLKFTTKGFEEEHFSTNKEINTNQDESTVNIYQIPSNFEPNDQLEFTTKSFEENYFSNNEKYNTNQDESTVNIYQTTPNFDTNEGSLKSNDISTFKSLDRISELETYENENNSKRNYLEGVAHVEDLSSTGKENDSLENSCNCNKKVMKNISSPTMKSNVGGIRTDTYRSPSHMNVRSHKLSDKSIKTNVAIKSKDNQNENNFEEPKTNALQESTFIIDYNQLQDNLANNEENKNTNTFLKKILSNDTIPNLKYKPLKLKNQRNNNYEERINNIDVTKNNKISFTPKNLPQKNSKHIIKQKPTSEKINIHFKEDTNYYATNTSKTTLKSPIRVLKKKVGQRVNVQEKPKEYGKRGENIMKKSQNRVSAKLKHNVSTGTNALVRGFGGKNRVAAAENPSSSLKTFPRTSTKIIHKPSTRTMSRQSTGRFLNDDDDDGGVIRTGPNESIITQSVFKHVPLNTNTRAVQTTRGNIDGGEEPSIDDLNPVRLRKPQGPTERAGKTMDDGNDDNGRVGVIENDVKTSTDGIDTDSFPPSVTNGRTTPGNERDEPPSSSPERENVSNDVRDVTTGPGVVREIGLRPRAYIKDGSGAAGGSSKSRPLSGATRTADDLEHGPYDAEHLKPLTFDGSQRTDAVSPDRAVESADGSHHGRRHESSTPDDGQRHVRPSVGAERKTNVLGAPPRADAFAVPLVGRATIDGGTGSARVSGVFVPIEQPADGRRATIPLTELLSASAAAADVCRSVSAPNSTTWTVERLVGDRNPMIREPVHIVQIINNGPGCPGTQSAGGGTRNGQRPGRRNARDGGERLRSSRSGKQWPLLNEKFKRAYDHFDSEILNKFLRVYSPPH